jgi:protein-tyrosine-phosphatase
MVTELLKGMRLAVARAMHPSRRDRAIEIVRAHAGARTLLVICHGNICRSPFAAAVLDYRVRPRGMRVLSAGLIGPGRPSPAVARAAAAARGIDLSAHRSQLVTPALLGQVDMVIVMDARQRAVLHHDYGVRYRDIVMLGDLDPAPIPGRGIADPYDRPLAEFEEVYARIERCLTVLVNAFGELAQERRPSLAKRAAIQRAAEPTSARISLIQGLRSSPSHSP